MDWQQMMVQERERLTKKRIELQAQIQDLNTALMGIDREMGAIDAYENAKNGKSARAPSGKRGSKRDAVLAIIKGTKGITRGEIIEQMGIKGNKSQEQALSNTLANLKKANTISAEGGKYVAKA